MAGLVESCSLEERCVARGGSPELLAELIVRLRDWLRLQPHLPQDVDDRRLEHFIVLGNHSLERAKQGLDMYFTVRSLVPEYFAERDPLGESVARGQQSALAVTMPKLTPDKYTVTCIRLRDKENPTYRPLDFYKLIFMYAEIHISECRSLGEILIIDFEGLQLNHIAKTTPTMLKKNEVVSTKAYRMKLKQIHYINVSSFMEQFLKLIKSVVEPKLVSKLHFHSSGIESLYEFVPKRYLPSDYGGEQPSMEELNEKWRHKLEVEWREWFLKEGIATADESLRPGPAINADDLFGIEGSFRKLEVD